MDDNECLTAIAICICIVACFYKFFDYKEMTAKNDRDLAALEIENNKNNKNKGENKK